jgi:iron complex transport system substrate-binding protein
LIVRLIALAVVAALALGETATAAPPRHIMSLNVCTDELLLDLVPADRIASVTFLSRSPSNSYLWPAAAHVAINRGSAEEALTENPDLVLAGTYAATQARLLLKKIGTPLLEVPPANSFVEIRDVTRMVAKAVGEPERGEAMIAHMDATLRALAATKPARTIRVVAWSGGGGVPGRGTLFDAILTVAGGVNIASATKGAEEGRFGLEQLLFAQPDVLAYGSEGYTAPSLRTDADQHPLLLKAFGRRRIVYPEALYSCGVPESADAAKALRMSLLGAMKFPKSVFE